jgi:hypothetical protein
MKATSRPVPLADAAARLRLLTYLQRDARRRGVPVERVIAERTQAEHRTTSEAPPAQGSLGEYVRREFLPVKEHDWSRRGDEKATWRASARRIALEIADSELGRLPFISLQRRDVP